MRAIECTKPGEMNEIKMETPSALEANEVIVAVKRIGVCGTDIHAYGGNQPFFTYPRILGHELSGIVETIGDEVTEIKAGDQVTFIPYMHCGDCLACKSGKTNCCTQMKVLGVHMDGGMAEFIKVPASHVIAVNDLSLDDAAVVEPLCIGAHAVRRADIQQGETALIIGAGPIGLGAARFAKLKGAKTIIMDISEERARFCREWAECDDAITVTDDVMQKLLDANNGVLPTVVLDATGNKNSMMGAFNYVSHGGKLVYIGLVKDTITFNDPDFHAKEMTLLSSRNATKEDFEYVIDCLSKGLVKTGYATKKIKLDHAIEFFTKGDFRSNKTIITLNS